MTDEFRKEVESAANAEAETEASQEPASETQTEEVSQETVTQEEKPKEKKMVPLDALHEERSKRKEMAAKLEKFERDQQQRDAIINQRLMQIAQVNQPQTQVPQIPDYNQDPLGHQQAKIQQLEGVASQMYQQRQIEMQNAARANQAEQIINWGRNKVSEFVSDGNKDWDQSYNHLRQVRAKELTAMGLQGTQLQEALKNDEFYVIQQAYQQGRNPAEIVYEMAKATGYQTPAAQVQKLQAGVQASKSLGSGGEVNTSINAQTLADMDDDDFQKLLKNGGWAKAMRKM